MSRRYVWPWMGDPCGISPELMAKLLAMPETAAPAAILVIGDRRVLAAGEAVAKAAQANAELVRLLAPYVLEQGGGCPVSLSYHGKGATCDLQLGERWKVRLSEDLISELREQLQSENVVIDYQPQAMRAQHRGHG